MDIIKKRLTSFDLKVIGIILMIFDHVYQMFYFEGVPMWFEMLGRPVAPIFVFLSAEGYYHTRNRKRYMLNLLFGYFICSVIFASISTFLPNSKVVLSNSIFGTLFLGLLAMWIYDGFFGKDKHFLKSSLGLLFLSLTPIFILYLVGNSNVPRIFAQLLFALFPTIFTVEGGITFVLLALFFHVFRNKRAIQCLIIFVPAILSLIIDKGSAQWMMIFSAIPIYLYNGEKGKSNKWFFYVFYPAHITLLYIISTLLFC